MKFPHSLPKQLATLIVCLCSRFWWLVCFSSSFLSVLPLTQWTKALPDSYLLSQHMCCWTNTDFFSPCCLYKLLNDFLQIDVLIFVTSALFRFLLCLLKAGRHVSSVGSLWIRQKSRCRPFLKCTGVSSTVLCQLINKWACAASTRAPRRHWWPTSQRTRCSSWATASVSRSSALRPDCTVAPSWGVFVWQRLSKLFY